MLNDVNVQSTGDSEKETVVCPTALELKILWFFRTWIL